LFDEKDCSRSFEQEQRKPESIEDDVNANNIPVSELIGNGEDDERKGQANEFIKEEASLESLQQKIVQMELEKEEFTNRLLRLQADFDNFRKRVRVEKEDLRQYAIFDFTKKMLPVIDNLERACAAESENEEDIITGLKMILKQLLEVFQSEGVIPIDCQGKPFDPNYHEAVLRDEDSDYPVNTVVEEFQKGYMMKDRVLRPSMVKVSVD
jgi:molecular chaperone GrpE